MSCCLTSFNKVNVSGRLIISLTFLILISGGYTAYGQHPNLKFEHFTSESGIAHGNIFDVYQDRKGFVWIGTERGLSRFDGSTYKTFKSDPMDSTSLFDHFIVKIAEGPDGILWLATLSGLSRFDPLTETFKNYRIDANDPAALQGSLEDLEVDSRGDVWIATDGGGVSRLDAQTLKFEHWRDQTDSTSLHALSLTEDRTGAIWVGLEGGLLDQINPDTGQVQRYAATNEGLELLGENDINALHTDGEGTIWLGQTEGLLGLDPVSGLVEYFPLDAGIDHPSEVVEISSGPEGVLWVSTFNEGVVRFDTQMRSMRRYAHVINDEESLAANRVRNVMQDRTGGLWVTTNGSLSRADLNRKPFLNYEHKPGVISSLSNDHALAITSDTQGNLWVGTINGLNLLDPIGRNFIRYFNDPNDDTSIALSEIWALHTDHSGNVWIGTYGEGLNRQRPGQSGFDHFHASPEKGARFQGSYVFTFYEDSRQQLWVGSDIGLHRYSPEKDNFELLMSTKTMDFSAVRSIVEDQYGVLWVGTSQHGLWSYEPKTGAYKHYAYDGSPGGLVGDGVFSLFVDTDKVLWVGTDRGLQILKRDKNGDPTGKFDLFTEKDGLSDNGIVGMLEDAKGRLWISTSNGLTRAEKKAPQTNTSSIQLSFKTFSHHDGLPSNTFYIGPTYEDVDGLFYFGSDKGIVIFDPLEIDENPHPPSVVISDIQLFNKSLEAGKPDASGRVLLEASAPYVEDIALDYKDRVFSISYAGLHFGAPGKNQFRYRLVGFEDAWVDAGDLRQATYTNLPAGEYQFEVMAANLDGVWSEEAASFRITVDPPFWQTTWFRFFAVALPLALIALFVQLRVRGIRRRNQLLEKRVAFRTEELNEKNALLAGKNEELVSINEALARINEELELRSEELKEALEKNKEILGVTAHDLKNPLGGIIGLADVILEDSKQLAADQYVLESRANIEMLKHEAENMLENIRDLLDRYRDNQVEQLKLEKKNLYQCVQTVVRWNRKAAMDKGIVIHVPQVADLSAQIDVMAIQRVMDNLISNAVKYSPPDGTISVDLHRMGESICFAVQDKGQGLTEADKTRVFGKMQRLSAKPTAGEHSTGLGLYIVKKLVEMHGGTVGVESESGQGATFWFKVPALVSSTAVS